MTTYTAKYGHDESGTPGRVEFEAGTQAEAIEQAKAFVRDGQRNGTWINMAIEGGAFAAVNEHGEAVSHTTRY